jgi:3-oxoacyl-[acyl-carrier-protein] synthase II
MRQIVVTGMGAVSPLGCGVETNWSRLLAGRSGIRTLPEAITADLSARVGGQVPDVDPEGGFDPDRAAPRKDQRKMDRFILFALGFGFGGVNASVVLRKMYERQFLENGVGNTYASAL